MSGSIGIAIPAYGRGRHVAQTLESALAQTRPAKEIIVVDDCSPDDTGEVARSFASRGVQYCRNPFNLGVPANYNHSLAKLTSDYVMILEDHDVLEPTFIEQCAKLLDVHPEVMLVASWIAELEEQTERVLQVFRPPFEPLQDGRRLAEYLLTRTGAPFGLTALIRRAALTGLEPWFDPKYWWYADIHLWIRLALRGKFGYVRQPLLSMRRREQGHQLEAKEWEGLLCCDRIRRDHWSQVFPPRRLGTRIKWARYSAARDYEAMRILLSRAARGMRDIPEEAHHMMSVPGRWLARALSRLPTSVAVALRTAHHALVPRV